MDFRYSIHFKLNQLDLLLKIRILKNHSSSQFENFIDISVLSQEKTKCPKTVGGLCSSASFQHLPGQHHTSRLFGATKRPLRDNYSVIFSPKGLENGVSVGLSVLARFVEWN